MVMDSGAGLAPTRAGSVPKRLGLTARPFKLRR